MNCPFLIFPFRGPNGKRTASSAFAALILIGCGGGVMPRSTNKIAMIPFQCLFLAGFSFCGSLLSLRFYKFILVLVQNAFK